MAADYVYSAQGDTIRVRIFMRGPRAWDFDVFRRATRDFFNYTSQVGEGHFETKALAKSRAEAMFGALRSINPSSITEGW